MNRTLQRKKVLKKCTEDLNTTKQSSFSGSNFCKNKNQRKVKKNEKSYQFLLRLKSKTDLSKKSLTPGSKTTKKMEKTNFTSKISRKLFEQQLRVKERQKDNLGKSLKIQNDHSIRINRGRIFDWFLDVFKAFNLGWQTYWCTLEIFDYLVFKHHYLRPQNVLLVGLTCLFMSSKIHQTDPPRLKKDILQSAAHNTITAKQIVQQEKRILSLCFNNGYNVELYHTPYNLSYQKFPLMSESERIELFRILLCVRIDPVKSLHTNDKQILYQKLIEQINQSMQKGQTFRYANIVMHQFTILHKCQNLIKPTNSLKSLRL